MSCTNVCIHARCTFHGNYWIQESSQRTSTKVLRVTSCTQALVQQAGESLYTYDETMGQYLACAGKWAFTPW